MISLRPLLVGALLTGALMTRAPSQTTGPYVDLACFAGPKWDFLAGNEFPGAVGCFALADIDGKKAGRLSYDFTKGGLYVGAAAAFLIEDGFEEFRFRVKSRETQRIMVRLFDRTGQCHQHALSYADEGEWQLLRVALNGRASTVFSGANDGKIHYPITKIFLGVEKSGASGYLPIGEVLFADIRLLK